MAVLMDVVRHLEASGLSVDNVATEMATSDHARVDAVLGLTVDGKYVRLLVEQRQRAPYPGEIARLANRHQDLHGHGVPMLVASFVGDEVGRRLVAAGWSWADGEGNYDIRADGIRLRQRLAHKSTAPIRHTLPRGRGGWAVIRWLIVNGDVTSLTELSLQADVSQPRISQVAGQLEGLGLLHRGRGRWSPVDRAELLDRFLKEYPGPGGSEVPLYSLDDPLDVVIRIARRRPRPSMAVSADVGVDLLVPWRSPTTVVIYTDAPLRLDRTPGVTPAHSRGDANIIHRVPDDHSIFSLKRMATVRGVDVPLADPVQMLWELGNLGGGGDRLEASERLRGWMLSHP